MAALTVDHNVSKGSANSSTYTVSLASSSSSSIQLESSHQLGDLERGIIEVKPTGHPVETQPGYSRYVLLGSVQQFWHYLRFDVCTTYRQLWTLVIAANIIAIVIELTQHAHDSNLPLANCINASMANLFVAIVIRQDYMKNTLYHICWSVPHSWPLWIRNLCAKIYEHGGVHSSAACASLMWFAVFTGFLWTTYTRGQYNNIAVMVFDIILGMLLTSIVLAAIPQFRRVHHNIFENIHRWAGWFGIALFWVALVLFANDSKDSRSLGTALAELPAFWLLLITSLHIIYPWLSLRKVEVIRVDRLSDHAVRLYFSPKEKIVPLHGVNISDAPLREWHAFAAISDIDQSMGGATSAIISKAGDWTSKTVSNPRSWYYMRGIHVTGTLDVAQLFRSVVVMATGSGIAPVMALFGTIPQTRIHLIWSAPSPKEIFGEGICQAVQAQDPNAIIWDTRKAGRPDLTDLAQRVYQESDAEAVFFISNRDLTRKVIRQLRERGVNAFAPIFDS